MISRRFAARLARLVDRDEAFPWLPELLLTASFPDRAVLTGSDIGILVAQEDRDGGDLKLSLQPGPAVTAGQLQDLVCGGACDDLLRDLGALGPGMGATRGGWEIAIGLANCGRSPELRLYVGTPDPLQTHAFGNFAASLDEWRPAVAAHSVVNAMGRFPSLRPTGIAHRYRGGRLVGRVVYLAVLEDLPSLELVLAVVEGLIGDQDGRAAAVAPLMQRRPRRVGFALILAPNGSLVDIKVEAPASEDAEGVANPGAHPALRELADDEGLQLVCRNLAVRLSQGSARTGCYWGFEHLDQEATVPLAPGLAHLAAAIDTGPPASDEIFRSELALAVQRGVDWLCRSQHADGHWKEFDLPLAGPSDCYVTALVGYLLATLPTGKRSDAMRAATRAAEYLTSKWKSGVGYNAIVAPDTDSTAHAVLLFASVGADIPSDAAALLISAQSDNGGFATYVGASPETFVGRWGEAHPDVTALTMRALICCDGRRRDVGRALRRGFACLEGPVATDFASRSYWWNSQWYTPAAWLVTFAMARRPLSPVFRAIGKPPYGLTCLFDAPFLLLWQCGQSQIALARRLAAALAAAQLNDGSWTPGAGLLLPNPEARPVSPGSVPLLCPELAGVVSTVWSVFALSAFAAAAFEDGWPVTVPGR